MKRTKNKKNKGKAYRQYLAEQQVTQPGYAQFSSPNMTIVNNPRFGFISPRCKSTFKYSTVVDVSAATTAGAQHVFKLNGMFDPDTTGTGHQPYGFDQMLNIYQRYVVVRARYKIVVGNTNDRLFVGAVAASTVTTAVTNLATFSLASESPYSQVKALNYNGGPPITLTRQIATNLLLGVTEQQMLADDLFQGTTSTDPTNLTVLTVFWYNPSLVTVSSQAFVSIEYEAILFDPYLQNQS